MTTAYHLAQINIARMRAPLTDPLMFGFVSMLDAVNALADQSEGFVWRLQTEDGNATSINAFDDDRLIINLTVWESIEALHSYVYRSGHALVFRDRREWFEPLDSASVALWWIPAGQLPTPTEGKARLEKLNQLGPTAEAFTFKASFPPPSEKPDARVVSNKL